MEKSKITDIELQRYAELRSSVFVVSSVLVGRGRPRAYYGKRAT